MAGLAERWLWRSRSCSCAEVADVCVGMGQVPQPGLGWLGEGEGKAVEGCQTDLEINPKTSVYRQGKTHCHGDLKLQSRNSGVFLLQL